MPRERALLIDWLLWFYENADFGPADEDVQQAMKQAFMDETGKNLPDGYQYDGEGEPTLDRA